MRPRPNVAVGILITIFVAGIAVMVSWYSHTINYIFAEAMTGNYRVIKVHGDGISRTIPTGHRLVFHIGAATVHRNCIVLWRRDDESTLRVARVTGVPGDKVPTRTRQRLAAGEYWLTRDRPGGIDSDVVGPISRNHIAGVAEYTINFPMRFMPLQA